MNSLESIIERDIKQYYADIEEHARRLRQCRADDEYIHRERMNCAAAVYNSLINYRDSLERK